MLQGDKLVLALIITEAQRARLRIALEDLAIVVMSLLRHAIAIGGHGFRKAGGQLIPGDAFTARVEKGVRLGFGSVLVEPQ
jgi:hypothetical protein